MNIKNMQVKDLIPYERNTKKHDKTQINNVAESIKQFGFVQPIVIDENNVVVIGHCRLLAAKQLKMKEVPCVCVEDLTEEQVKALRIIDNKTNESPWDFDLLPDELADLDLSAFDFDFGIEDEEKETEIVEDEPPEIDEEHEPITKLGDIWQLGRHRLMCGDSFNEKDVKKLCSQNVDTILFDPPFEREQFYKDIYAPKEKQNILVFTDYKHWGAAIKGAIDAGWNPMYEFVWNNVQSWYTTKNRPLAQHKTCYVFGDEKKWNFDKAIINDDVKRKKSHSKNAAGRGEYNYIPLKNGKHLSTVFDFSSTSLHDEHGQGKPIRWFAAILNGLDANVVFDAFSGSGTGIMACEQTEKTCFAMEIEPKYCDQAIKRYENFTGEKATKI